MSDQSASDFSASVAQKAAGPDPVEPAGRPEAGAHAPSGLPDAERDPVSGAVTDEQGQVDILNALSEQHGLDVPEETEAAEATLEEIQDHLTPEEDSGETETETEEQEGRSDASRSDLDFLRTRGGAEMADALEGASDEQIAAIAAKLRETLRYEFEHGREVASKPGPEASTDNGAVEPSNEAPATSSSEVVDKGVEWAKQWLSDDDAAEAFGEAVMKPIQGYVDGAVGRAVKAAQTQAAETAEKNAQMHSALDAAKEGLRDRFPDLDARWNSDVWPRVKEMASAPRFKSLPPHERVDAVIAEASRAAGLQEQDGPPTPSRKPRSKARTAKSRSKAPSKKPTKEQLDLAALNKLQTLPAGSARSELAEQIGRANVRALS